MSVEFTVVDDEKVVEVINAINNLPDEITLEDEDAIVAARKAYDELTESQKSMVEEDVLAKLVAAEEALEELKTPPTEPVTETGDIFPVAALLFLLTAAAGMVAFRKKIFSKS